MLPKPQVNILLVDDRIDNLIALESVLEELGQTLVRAHSGSEALKCVLNQEFAVILLDVQMPGMDGFETAELMRAREKSRHIPIIFLTAINKNDTHVFKGYSVGAVDYVFKPFEPDVLRAKVAAFVEMSRNVTRLHDEIAHRRETEARLDASNAFLETISRGLMMFIADGRPFDALNHLLQNLLAVTQSDYGFIVECIHTANDTLNFKLHAISWAAQASLDPGTPPEISLVDTEGLHAVCDAVEQSRRSFVVNDHTELCAWLPPLEDGSLQSLMAMPLYRGDNLVGVVGIANCPKGYSEDLSVTLEPLCSTCATIIHGYRNAQHRQEAEEAVQRLNEDLECRVQERTAELEAANKELQNEIVQRERAKEVLAYHQSHIETLNKRLRRSMTETHHRVKNNLQVISAMIDMQVLEYTGEQMIPLEEFVRLRAHIHTLSVVHDLLTLSIKEEEEDQRISTKAVLEKLLPMLQRTAWKQTVHYSVEDVELTSKQCIALALVLNELVSNALKHGNLQAEVVFIVDGENAVLSVSDDGEGFPEGFDPKKAANTGLELVSNLVHIDLTGVVIYDNQAQGGGRVIVTFPLPATEE